MPPLHPDLRAKLEKACIDARDLAEAAARAALTRLAIGEREPFGHLSSGDRDLRVRLRARGRQLGDVRDATSGHQAIDRLVHEVAYEHWHRMLFARFLAENHLLIHPDHNVPVTLKECEELAADEGDGADAWTLAGRFAARMLPQVFRPDDPVLALRLAPEHQIALEKLLAGLPTDVFVADDGLGWVYQFWQTKRKGEVNASGDKITGETLPAVTQLFTEHYMVLFLLHNTIGAWWAGKTLRHDGEKPEPEWRRRVALDGYEFDYLRFRPDGTPAAGNFPGWPRRAAELRVLDPCCGSGHFLTAVFDLLVRLRMREEGLAAAVACDAVLRDNVFGLELDPRCTQIAAFALAFAAWRFPRAGGYRSLPQINVACSGLAVAGKKEEWLTLAGGDSKLQEGMYTLYDVFRKGPELGSLIDVRRATADSLLTASFAELQPLLRAAIAREEASCDAQATELGVMAQGIARAAELLAESYDLVVTNVPYLGRKLHSDDLRAYADSHATAAKAELATIFVMRAVGFLRAEGTFAVVTPQNWLFLTSYKEFRERLLRTCTWNCVAKLGPAAFTDMNWWAANTALVVVSRTEPTHDAVLAGLDVSGPRAASQKAALLRGEPPETVQVDDNAGWAASSDPTVQWAKQSAQLENPDARIAFEGSGGAARLERVADSLQGIASADYSRFGRFFWELPMPHDGWEFQQSTVEQTCAYGGREHVLYWEDGRGAIAASHIEVRARIRGLEARGRRGVAISQMRHLPATLFTGELFDNNTAVIVPHEDRHLPAIWAFCTSPEFSRAVRQLDQKVNVTNATFAKVPFDVSRWTEVARTQFPAGLPAEVSTDPTQWIHDGTVRGSLHPLQVAVARLLGYRWPRQSNEPDAVGRLVEDGGVVCIPAVGTERAAADRLTELLAASYGTSDWTPSRLGELLAGVGFVGRSLDEWLRDGFFEQHCATFHQRPLVWQISDGRRKDGFHALVNYHRFDRRRLDKLIYAYLGDWIQRQRDEARRGVVGADARLAAAELLQTKLKLIAEGEAPHDIFVRWKPLAEQPIGWEPDVNDGVRANIRPLVEAGVLRKNPKIHWRPDRGKDPTTEPWAQAFQGERRNDHHLTLAEKRAARESAGSTTRKQER